MSNSFIARVFVKFIPYGLFLFVWKFNEIEILFFERDNKLNKIWTCHRADDTMSIFHASEIMMIESKFFETVH